MFIEDTIHLSAIFHETGVDYLSDCGRTCRDWGQICSVSLTRPLTVHKDRHQPASFALDPDKESHFKNTGQQMAFDGYFMDHI